MSTLIRPELSETNRYWIEKHRYYELKHFCLQYPLWRHAYNSLIDYPGSWPQLVPPCKTNVVSDPVIHDKICQCVGDHDRTYDVRILRKQQRAGLKPMYRQATQQGGGRQIAGNAHRYQRD